MIIQGVSLNGVTVVDQLGVVQSNLQLYLNAADSASYPGSGTTWTDLSPNAYSTTLVGAPTFNSTYFTFDGSTEYVDTNQSLAAESFSVGAWFRSSAAGTKMILSKESTAGTPWNYRLWLNGGALVGDISTNDGVRDDDAVNYAGSLNNGAWHLAMFTRNTTSMILYVDGVQVATASNTLIASVSNAQELWIGRSAFTQGGSSPTGSYQYTGDIGQVFIYNDVLTPAEILQNYNATKATYGL